MFNIIAVALLISAILPPLIWPNWPLDKAIAAWQQRHEDQTVTGHLMRLRELRSELLRQVWSARNSAVNATEISRLDRLIIDLNNEIADTDSLISRRSPK